MDQGHDLMTQRPPTRPALWASSPLNGAWENKDQKYMLWGMVRDGYDLHYHPQHLLLTRIYPDILDFFSAFRTPGNTTLYKQFEQCSSEASSIKWQGVVGR